MDPSTRAEGLLSFQLSSTHGRFGGPGRRALVVILLSGLMTLSFSTPSEGATWEPVPFEQAVKEADLIVLATVTDIHSYFEKGEVSLESGGRNLIRSNVTLDLEGPGSVWKGGEQVGADRQLIINTIGGQVGDIILINNAMHAFVVGERLVVFLKAIPPEDEFTEGAGYRIPSGSIDTFILQKDGSIQSLRFEGETPEQSMTLMELRWKIEDALANPTP